MKKILALVLALVMTMSLATISSGAAFSDADEVRYADAVNTLSALGVLGGYGDGTIRPAADVTRGAAAKMVAMVATGSNTTAIGYYAGTSSFADVPASHTFADAVAFCVARGIVAGYGDGTYGVSDNVKGWAVAKMVLVAMGYDAAAYGMEGAGSALNTITLASQLGLFAGMKADFVATAAASREECAQIVYNALTLNGKVANPTTNNGVVSFSNSDTCLLNNYDGVADVAAADLGKVTALKAMAANIGMLTKNQDTGATYTTIGGKEYAVETGKELIGHYVLAVKNGAEDEYKKPCVYAVVDLSSVVELASDITAKTVKAKDKFEAAFGTVAAKDTVVEFYNYKDTEKASTDNFNAKDYTANAGTYVIYGDKVVSYMTAASDVVVLTVEASAANQAKGYYTVKNGKDVLVNVEEDATKCYDLIVSDEAINWLGMLSASKTKAEAVYIGTPCGDKLAIADVATVEGKVTQLNTTDGKWDNGTIYVDGVAYGYVDGYSAAAGVLYATAFDADKALPGFTATYTFYLNAYGQIFAFAAKTAEDTNAYELAYISGTTETVTGEDVFGNKSYAYSIQYYKMDGSVNLASYVAKDGLTVVNTVVTDTAEVKYEALSGWALIANVDGGIAVKSLNSKTFTNGYKVEEYKVAEKLELKATSTTMNSDFINSASTFLYTKDSGFKSTNKAATVKTGAHASEIGAATMSVVVKESANIGKEDIVAVWVGNAFAGTTITDVEFVYVVSYNGQVGYAADGKTPLYQYTVIDKNGAEATATYKNEKAAGSFYKLSTDTATGLVSLGDEYKTVASLKGASVYTIDGVKYALSGSEYVVTSAKVIDLRAGVAAGTAELVSTVEEATALTGDVVVSAIYTTDELTKVMTVGTIIVADAPAQNS